MSNFVINPYIVTTPQECATTQAWEDSSTADMSALAGTRYIQGAIILSGSDFIGQNLKTATFYIKKTGSPEGTISCKLYPSAVILSGLATVTETASNTFSIQTGWSDGDHEFTFSGDNDIAENNALVIFCTFTSSDGSNYVNCVARPDTTSTTEAMRQYEKGDPPTPEVWEGQSNLNPRFKVCN